MPLRPERMYRRGRPIVPVDDGVEPLYRRFSADQLVDEALPGPCFRFPDCSVNRGGANFGQPEDVIFDFPSWGILKILVADVPPRVRAEVEGASEFPLLVEHVPEEKEGEENYAHCEIRIYQIDPQTKQLVHRKKDLPDGPKKVWRRQMSKRATIYKRAADVEPN